MGPKPVPIQMESIGHGQKQKRTSCTRIVVLPVSNQVPSQEVIQQTQLTSSWNLLESQCACAMT